MNKLGIRDNQNFQCCSRQSTTQRGTDMRHFRQTDGIQHQIKYKENFKRKYFTDSAKLKRVKGSDAIESYERRAPRFPRAMQL